MKMNENSQDKISQTYKQLKKISVSTWGNAKEKTEQSLAEFKGTVDRVINRFKA
ncbi:MAG TPA: hypothetical protein VN611_08530 [Patescibacteria group bacterium]|nr:hypothetical protein [Patescibacteria group bacterium]